MDPDLNCTMIWQIDEDFYIDLEGGESEDDWDSEEEFEDLDGEEDE